MKVIDSRLQLYWTCPSCGITNSGENFYCSRCGLDSTTYPSIIYKTSNDEVVDRIIIDAENGTWICPDCGIINSYQDKYCNNCQYEMDEDDLYYYEMTEEPYEMSTTNCSTVEQETCLLNFLLGLGLTASKRQREEKSKLIKRKIKRKFMFLYIKLYKTLKIMFDPNFKNKNDIRRLSKLVYKLDQYSN